MAHVRSKILKALVDSLKAVDVLGLVEAMTGLPLDPAIKTSCQVGFDNEKSDSLSGESQDPRDILLDRKAVYVAVIEAPVAKDVDIYEFEDELVAAAERAVAMSEPLRDLADTWHLVGTAFEYAEDRKYPTVKAQLTWGIMYKTIASDPGTPR